MVGTDHLVVKVCCTCGLSKALTDFRVFRPESNICKACFKLYHKNWYAKNKKRLSAVTKADRQARPEYRHAINWKSQLKQLYNLTPEQYQKMFLYQDGKCALCKQPETSSVGGKLKRLSIDHDHKTDMIRGLLCSKCNMALERFDNVFDWVSRVATYLRTIEKRVA